MGLAQVTCVGAGTFEFRTRQEHPPIPPMAISDSDGGPMTMRFPPAQRSVFPPLAVAGGCWWCFGRPRVTTHIRTTPEPDTCGERRNGEKKGE